MPKTTKEYWNVFDHSVKDAWAEVPGTNGMLEFLTLSNDEISGDYTRLTKFKPGADTSATPGKSHDYPEEVYIVSGSLYDFAFQRLLKAGDYASRPPGELHGPFKTEEGCLVLEISFPSQSINYFKNK